MTRRRLAPLFLAAVIPLAAAPHVEVVVHAKPYRSGAPLDLKPKLATLQRIAWTPPHPAAAAVLAADCEVFAHHFHARLGDPLQSTTFTRDREDVLLARFPLQTPQAGIREVIVWDEPGFVSFLFRIDPTLAAAPDRLQAWLEQTVNWDLLGAPRREGAPDEYETPLKVFLFRASPGQFSGVGQSVPSSRFLRQLDSPRSMFLEMIGGPTLATLDFTIAKGDLTSSFPKGMSWIPERFPPLSERVKSWTLDQLLDDVHALQSKSWLQAHDRTEILMQEVLRRDPPNEQLAAILLDPRIKHSTCARVLLRLIEQTGQAARREPALREYLRTAPPPVYGK